MRKGTELMGSFR